MKSDTAVRRFLSVSLSLWGGLSLLTLLVQASETPPSVQAKVGASCEQKLLPPAASISKGGAPFQRSLTALEAMLAITPETPRVRAVASRSNPAAAAPIQAGFESEYTLAESDRLLTDYFPDVAFFPGMTQDSWRALTHDEKIAWIKAKIVSRMSPEDLDDGALVPLILDRSSPLSGFLPEQLFLDSTGNLEIILGPAPTLEEWLSRVLSINARFGEGSMQSTVGVSHESFFDEINEHLGFLLFTNELDTLQKLQAGARKWGKDKTAEVARSFKHPWVGPMTLNKQTAMREMIVINAKKQGYDDSTRYAVRKSEGSFKYIGGTAYRPDIAGLKAVVLELRDAHKNTELLKERVFRAAYALINQGGPFAGAIHLQAFDSEKDYAKLPTEVREALERVVPSSKAKRGNLAHTDAIALQVYRNWGYPLKNWEPALQFLGRADLQTRVKRAMLQYRWKMLITARRLNLDRTLTPAEADREFQAALAEFAEESGLADAFTSFFETQFLGLGAGRLAAG
jgi:hypothetical protein